MAVITRDEIERRNARDLAMLLEDVLDMSVTRYGAYGNQTEMSMRGFDTERIAILIDGVPANSPRSGEFDVSQVNMNDVERVEVIYGGSDTKYNVSGAFAAPYIYGLYWRGATKAGAYAGLLSGLATEISLFIILGAANSPLAASFAILVPFIVVPVVSRSTQAPPESLVDLAFVGLSPTRKFSRT